MGQKQESNTPKLYKRGSEDINLEVFNNDAVKALQYKLANSRLKDEQKQAVEEAFTKILEGINDGKVTYRISGGFDNSIGLENTIKGFDAAGIAAGIMGQVLRNQDVYTPPVEESDTSKTKWEGNSSIKDALTKYIFGDGEGNIKDFIGLDYNPETKQVNGNIERSKKLQEGLRHIQNNFDNLFTSFDGDKESFNADLTAAINALENGLTENEYLAVAKVTGLSNLSDLFSNTYEQQITTPSVIYNNEQDYQNALHPRTPNIKLHSRPVRIGQTRYHDDDLVTLENALQSLPKDKLIQFIGIGLKYNPSGQELNKVKEIKQAFGGVPNFENEVILSLALELGRNNNYFHQFNSNSNNYYVPIQSDKLNDRNIGIVYEISPNGNHRIKEMERNDIPFFTNQWHQDFISSQVPSQKQGGTLIQKFQGGGISNTTYNPDKYSWVDIIYNTQHFKDVLSGINKDNYKEINALQDRFYNDKINDNWNQSKLNRNELVRQYQTKFNDFFGTKLNEGAIEDAINKGIIRRNNGSGSGDNKKNGYADGYSGAMTNLRHLGTNEHAQYISAMNEILKENGLEAFVNPKTNMINYQPITKPTDQDVESTDKQTNVDKESTEKQTNIDLDFLREKLFGGNNNTLSTPKPSLWDNIGTELLGAGRLWHSLNTNKKVYNTVLPALDPLLQDTYERYSPVTGNFGAMQLKNQQAANILSQSAKPFTSDANLASARMLEGNLQASQLQTQGFLADDQEIKRTQAEALNRQEDNMPRRSKVANDNRKALNINEREKAQLKAAKLKQDWQSVDNFLQGIESRLRGKFEENRERSNNFYDRLISSQTQNWLTEVLEPAEQALQEWSSDPKNKDKDPSIYWPEWKYYVKFKREANNRASAMINSNLAKRYNLKYENDYPEQSYDLFNWNNRRVI